MEHWPAGERVVYVIAKGKKTEIRALVRRYAGEWLAELRTFVLRRDGQWRPTAHGVTLGVERAGELLAAARALAGATRPPAPTGPSPEQTCPTGGRGEAEDTEFPC